MRVESASAPTRPGRDPGAAGQRGRLRGGRPAAHRAARLRLRLRGPAREDELGDRREERLRGHAPRLPVRAPRPRAAPLAHPAPARHERAERARAPDVRPRRPRPRLRRRVRGGPRPRPRPRPLDHPRRPRPLGGDPEAAAGRLRAPDPHPLARPARGAGRVLQPHVARDPAAHAGAGGEGEARGGAAHRAADPDEPAARPGLRHAWPGCAWPPSASPRPRWGATTTTSCPSARRGWASSWPTSRARAPRPPSTWPSSRGSCCRSRGSTTRRRGSSSRRTASSPPTWTPARS